MKILRAKITNFRLLKEVEVDFDSVTTLIGSNGAGKSSILRALDWFFNGSKSGDLSEDDCSFGATNVPIEVQVTFGDLTESDRSVLSKYAPPGSTTFTAWKRRTPDGNEYLSANAKGLPEFTEIKRETSATAKKDKYKALREERPELDLPEASTGPTVDAAMATWEADHVDQLEDVPETIETNFFGFNSGGKMSQLFCFVLVTADLRASEESLDAKASVLGKIIERGIDRTSADEEISDIVGKSRAAQQAVYDKTFAEPLADIKKSLDTAIAAYSPGRAVMVKPKQVDLKAPRTSFEVSILDGATETPVERQGHGFQRTLLISALQYLATSGAAAENGVFCLAIEEPELFQHPNQARTFAKVLRSLAEDPTQRIQVTYATHSPWFVEAHHFDQVRRVTRDGADVSIHRSSITEVTARLGTVLDAATVQRQLDGAVSMRLADALFAERALLVEGTTDVEVIYGIGDRDSTASLESAGLAVIDVGGKGNIPLAHAVLSSLGIATHCLADGDKGSEARAAAAAKPVDKVAEVREASASANKRLLKYFGQAEIDFPDQGHHDGLSIIGDRLEELLDAEWPEWSTSCHELETETGVPLAKNRTAYRTATRRAGGAPSTFLAEVIGRAKGDTVDEVSK